MTTQAEPAARSQDHAAGMGAGPRPADAGLSRGRAHRPGPRSGVPRRRAASRIASPREGRPLQARRRAGRRGGHAEARRRQARTGSMAEPDSKRHALRLRRPRSARPTPASRRWSTRWSAPRSRSSRRRCRPRARWCAASPSTAPAQLVLVDTPGIFAPRRRLDRAMVDDRLGRRAATPTSSPLLVDAQRGRRRGGRGDRRPPRARSAQPKHPGAQQDRSRRQADAAGAGAGAQRSARPSTRPS